MCKRLYLSIGTFVGFFLVAAVSVNFLPIGTKGSVYISKGQSSSTIHSNLYQKGAVKDIFAFKLMQKAFGKFLKAGEFSYNENDTPSSLLTKIHNNKYMYRSITIVEGLTVIQVSRILRLNPYLTGAIVANNADMLLPETYYFVRGHGRTALYKTMQDEFMKLALELWNAEGKNSSLNSLKDAVILASIVEKETGLDGERHKVASVFMNRLSKGMRLQSDPTTIYALSNGEGYLNRPLNRKDWKFKSPFNTYYIKGLPPYPIAGVGYKALKAVLKPAKTEYYYFVATGKGGHYFAKTLREHNNNYKKYKETLSKQ